MRDDKISEKKSDENSYLSLTPNTFNGVLLNKMTKEELLMVVHQLMDDILKTRASYRDLMSEELSARREVRWYHGAFVGAAITWGIGLILKYWR